MVNGPLYQPTRTRRDLNQVLIAVGSIATDLAGILAELATLESEMDTAQGDIDNLEAADIALDGRLDTAEGNITTLDGRLDTAEPEIDALQGSVTSLDGRLDSAEADAAVLGSDAAPDGRVLTADGAGGAAWEALPALANHDHSGDVGDGGSFDAANLASGASADGQVLTSDGAAGAAWESLPAIADHDHSGDMGDGGLIMAEHLDSDIAPDGYLLTANGSGGCAWESAPGDMYWATIQAHQIANEVKNFPAMVGMDVDLDTTDQWWYTIGTPTTTVRMVDVAGEGITENYEYALKCVADAANEGFEQRWWYGDEVRLKSGRTMSAIAAVYLATGSRTVTMALRTASGTVVSSTNSMSGAWVIMKCENLALNNSYVEMEFYINGSGTFYVVPLGANVGSKAFQLPPRGLVYREAIGSPVLVNGVDPGGASWTDVDCTSNTTPLCCIVRLNALYRNATRVDQTLSVRRNGDTTGWGQSYLVRTQSTTAYTAGYQDVVVDENQIFEYMTNCAAADVESIYIKLLGWWEWA